MSFEHVCRQLDAKENTGKVKRRLGFVANLFRMQELVHLLQLPTSFPSKKSPTIAIFMISCVCHVSHRLLIQQYEMKRKRFVIGVPSLSHCKTHFRFWERLHGILPMLSIVPLLSVQGRGRPLDIALPLDRVQGWARATTSIQGHCKKQCLDYKMEISLSLRYHINRM